MTSQQKKQLVFLLTAVILVIFTYSRHTASAEAEILSDFVPLSISSSEEPFLLAASGFTSYGILPDLSVRVHWWNNPEEDGYYLFLPSAADLGDLTLEFAGADSILFDQTPLKSGDSLPVTLGLHQVSVPELDLTYSLTVMQSSSLSSLYLDTASGSLERLKADKEHLESGYLKLADADGSITYSGELEYIKGHGNATWTETDKKAWQIKLLQKADLGSMGAAKKWMLLPNCFDDSLLRNHLTMHIAREIGLSYTPEAIFVDYYVNGEYQGNYQLAEKIEIHEERIAIANLGKETEQLNTDPLPEYCEPYHNGENGLPYSSKGYMVPTQPADITGGYLLEIELLGRYQEETAGFVTTLGRSIVIKEPSFPSKEQVNYISTLYEETEAAIFSPDGCNDVTGKHFSEYLDVESFAKKYIIEELSKNMDASVSSQYFYKPEDTVDNRFYCGPIWDYDNAWGYGGIVNDVELYNPDTFYANLALDDATLWYGLYQQPYFYENLCRIYQTEVLPVMDEVLSSRLKAWTEALTDSAMMNNYRWNTGLEFTPEESKERYLNKVEYMGDFAAARNAFLAEAWAIGSSQTAVNP